MPYKRYLPWLMWLFPMVFFGFQFILRLFPGLILNEFMEKYAITATDFGLFASLYYLGYAGMQIPLAICLDKFGPRKVVSLSILICGLATWLFVIIPSWPIALLSRFLIGAASVVGFLGASKVISLWFAPEKYARLVGLTFSFGLLGAVYGGRPISHWITTLGWENVCLLLGGAAISLACLCYLFLRDGKNEQIESQPVITSLKTLMSNKSILILALANLFMVGSLEGFADVWGVSYLMTARDLTKLEASGFTSFIFIGMLFGGPVLAFFAEKFNADYLVTMVCGILMSLLLFSILLMPDSFSNAGLKAALFLVGILCCYQVIIFAIGAKWVSSALVGITIAFLNCINMLGGSFFHTTIGYLMDLSGPGYTIETYTFALMVIPIASMVGALLVGVSRFFASDLSPQSDNTTQINTTITVGEQ